MWELAQTGKKPAAGLTQAPWAEGWLGQRFPWLSAGALVGANLVPLLGVFLAGWRVFPIMLLFSLENIVIGFYNVLRMVVAPCDLAELKRNSEGIPPTKAGLIGFFCVHYGAFVFGHLFFVVMLFGVALRGHGQTQGKSALLELLREDGWRIGWAFAAMWVSHGVSYWQNFIRGREYTRVTAKTRYLHSRALYLFGNSLWTHICCLDPEFGK